MGRQQQGEAKHPQVQGQIGRFRFAVMAMDGTLPNTVRMTVISKTLPYVDDATRETKKSSIRINMPQCRVHGSGVDEGRPSLMDCRTIPALSSSPLSTMEGRGQEIAGNGRDRIEGSAADSGRRP